MKKKLLFVSFVFFQYVMFAQEDAWVYFADKEDIVNSIANPLTILTQKAIDRKTKHNIAIDSRDVPVNENYISQIKNTNGIAVLAKSKWFNNIHVRGSEIEINSLLNFSFVNSIKFANDDLNRSSIQVNIENAKFSVESSFEDFDYGNTRNQVEMINVDDLHLADYTGEGIIIAVIDVGFPNVNTIGAFQRLRDAGKLLSGYDFVDRTSDVYANDDHDHGTKVLSTMAGFIENQYVGTAPDASYYVFRTEYAGSENPVEESFWVEAIERADSLGVDIINSSLAYKNYDDARYDYTSEDMDGNTTFITKGANVAFEKGILVLNSAGNDGNNGIHAPADAAGVFTIGAVDENEAITYFSSVGSDIQPTQKPDVVARGGLAYVINKNNAIVRNSGTSFSSPIMAGAMACLMQALPNKTNEELMQLVRESSSQFNSPDYQYGYGVPDLFQALEAVLTTTEFDLDRYNIYPNPTENNLFVKFPKEVDQSRLKIFDLMGKLVIDTVIQKDNNVVSIESIASGVYLVQISNSSKINTFKLLKK